MSSVSALPHAAGPVSPARAAASRRNGAKSRGPKTAEGKARSAQNALKHGLRAVKHVVLPDEDAVEFAQLQTALFAELASEGALQLVLARPVAIAAWRLAPADRLAAVTGLGPSAGWGEGLGPLAPTYPANPDGKGLGAPSPDGKGSGPRSPTTPATPDAAANRSSCSSSGAGTTAAAAAP